MVTNTLNRIGELERILMDNRWTQSPSDWEKLESTVHAAWKGLKGSIVLKRLFSWLLPQLNELDTIMPVLQTRKLKLRLHNFPKVPHWEAPGACIQGVQVGVTEKSFSVKHREEHVWKRPLLYVMSCTPLEAIKVSSDSYSEETILLLVVAPLENTVHYNSGNSVTQPSCQKYNEASASHSKRAQNLPWVLGA